MSHVNAMGKGINSEGWVGNQACRLTEEEKEEVRSLEDISKNLSGNLKIEILFKMTILSHHHRDIHKGYSHSKMTRVGLTTRGRKAARVGKVARGGKATRIDSEMRGSKAREVARQKEAVK